MNAAGDAAADSRKPGCDAARIYNPMRFSFTKPAFIRCAVVFLLLLGIPADAAGPSARPARLSLEALQGRFETALARQDRASLNALATENQDLLRPLVETLLTGASNSVLEGDEAAVRKRLALATAVAEAAKDVSDDPFPLRQVGLCRSWSREEHLLKSRADSLFARARTAFDEGRYGDVLAPGRSALECYAALRDDAGAGDALHDLGQAGRRLADYESALAWHEQALQRARQARDRLRQGRALIDLGDVHERRKELAQAMSLYRQALQVLKPPADRQEAIRALRQIGDVHVATGNFKAAYGTYNQALIHAERGQDAQRVSEIHDYLGFCHRRLGDYGKAIEHHRRALESAEGIADADARLRARARSLNHLGICTAKLAEAAAGENNRPRAVEKYREAIGCEEEALDLSSKARDRWRQGYILRSLSLMHRELGGLLAGAEAVAQYGRSLAWAEEALALAAEMKEKEWEGLALHDRGLALALLGREREGLAAFDRALGLWGQIGDLQSAGFAHRFAARQFHETAGRFDEALSSYDRALQAFGKIGDAESEGITLTDKARVNASRGRTGDAARLYDEGLAKLEGVRTKAGFLEFRKAFMGKIYDRYEEAAVFALGQGFNERAFRYAESMKARTFLDQLAESRVELEKGIDPELKKRRDALERDLLAAGARITEEHRRPTPDERVLASSRAEMERAEEELGRVKKQIRLTNPLYASVQYPEPVAVAELQKKILSDDETLLEYFLTAKGVFCFVVTRERFQTARLAVSEEKLREKVEALLDNLESGPARGEGYDRAAAGELYDILLKPVEKSLEGRALIVVPDGILARLPFEALVVAKDGGRTYLLEENPVKYVQSASVLATLRTSSRPAAATGGFVGFGDPVYDFDRFRKGEREDVPPGDGGAALRRYAGMAGRLSRLEASGDEVRGIDLLFREGNREGKTFLRAEARESSAKGQAMERYGYIHFSMHGILAPGYQAIAFSQIPGEGEDGLLTLGEIMNLRYNARLVVLSACQTGLGRAERGEGVTGLTRAVMYAGSPAAVVSLWSVDDRGTRELMTRFYENMIRKEAPKTEALRTAKHEMIKTRWRHPYFWAAFVMYGE